MREKKELQIAKLHEIGGFQHAQDDYWFRPLVLNKNLFT
jgi:hypothetical protein